MEDSYLGIDSEEQNVPVVVKPQSPIPNDAISITMPSVQISMRCGKFRITITPETFTYFKYVWDPLLIFILLASVVDVPLSLAFDLDISLHSTSGIISFLIDMFLCIDIGVNFISAYLTDPQSGIKMYLKRRFTFDLLVSIPLELIFGDGFQWIQSLRILRVLRMMRVARILSMIRVYERIKKRMNLPISTSKVIYIKLAKVSFGMLLGAHYFACLWWGIGTTMSNDGYDSWVDQIEVGIMIDEGKQMGNVDRLFAQYTVAYYWSIVTLFTTGYGDIFARNIVECWISVLTIFIGTIYISYLIGLATAFVENGDDMKRVENAKLKTSLKNATSFAKHHGISKELTRAMQSHIRYHYSSNYVVCDAEQEILNDLPHHLRVQIESEIASQTLKDIDFLNDYLPLQVIGQIALKMKLISCRRGHWLFRKNTIGNTIYIQKSGVAMMYIAVQSVQQ